MTRAYNRKVYCPKCGTEHTEESAFDRWLRQEPRLDSRDAGIVVYDCDILIHRYKLFHDKRGDRTVQCMMFVEVKSNGAELTQVQRDTLSLFAQILRNDRKTPTKTPSGRLANNGPIPAKSFGSGVLVATFFKCLVLIQSIANG